MTSRAWWGAALIVTWASAGCGGGGGGAPDTGVADAAGPDSGTLDAATSDAGTRDAGTSDAGTSDVGIDDAGGRDGGGDATASDAGRRVPRDHRPDDSACAGPAPAGDCVGGGGGGGLTCGSDADCTDGTNGRCNASHGGVFFCRCTYDVCAQDSDCPTGQTCACHGTALHPESNECVPGNCRVDSDCGPGGFCSPTVGSCGGLGGYYCHTAADTCVDDTDCTSGIQACTFVSTSARWECTDLLLCP